MVSKRYLTVRDLPPQKPGCCRWCEKPLPARCSSWCGPECRETYQLLSLVGAQRRAVFKRDHGVCATCGLDTWELHQIAARAAAGLYRVVEAVERDGWRDYAHHEITTHERERLLSMARLAHHHEIDGLRRRWNAAFWLHGVLWRVDRRDPPEAVWQMDHVVPVVEGGGVRFGMTRDEVMSNLRTLCVPCHKRETAALAARRAKPKRAVRVPAPRRGVVAVAQRTSLIDLTGKRFGKLVVIRRADTVSAAGQPYWFVRCDCGTEKDVQGMSLRRGATRSCGCEMKRKTAERNTKHGLMPRKGRSPEYDVWSQMVRRCTDPNHPHYHNYGGRGIAVDPTWRTFAAFLKDMGSRPSALHSLERRDNDGPYSKDNCEWATRDVQARNRRTNRPLTFRGETMLMCDWAVRIGMKYGTLSSRLRYGWSVERALTEPLSASSRLARHRPDEKEPAAKKSA